MRDVGRLVRSPAVRNRRQIRGIGLDQKAVFRHKPRDIPQGLRVFEGDYPRERDREVEIEDLAREIRAFGKAMQDASDIGCALLAQDPQGIGGRLARMNDEGLRDLPGRGDVLAKLRLLVGGIRPLQSIVIKASLAERNDTIVRT